MNRLTNNIARKVGRRWGAEGGYKELFRLAVPLIVSTGAWSVQLFFDRTFLTWFSRKAVAAAVPAGMLNFTIVSLFLGTATYVSTFVSQYYGSGQKKRVGPSTWQGIYIAALAGLAMLVLRNFSGEIFSLIGHSPIIQQYESAYFKILCLGAFPLVASNAMSGLFSGLGRTYVIMIVNALATVTNLVLNNILIFGKLGFPRMGIEGAGIATVISACFSLFVYLIIISRRVYREEYSSLKGWRYNTELFRRLIRFGLPSGIHFFLEMTGFNLFILFIGRLGEVQQAATNIAIVINTMAFMPMIGLGIAVSVMVGQNLGRDDPERAYYSVISGFHVGVIYTLIFSVMYILVPKLFLAPFAAKANPAEFGEVAVLVITLLKFVAVYCIFDGCVILFASALKGAGDTRFVMYTIVILSLSVLVVPTYLVLFVFKLGIYAGWTPVTTYIVVLGVVLYIRFRGGKWQSMRVIEEFPMGIPPSMSEGSAGQCEV